jgi:hypothetical protein
MMLTVSRKDGEPIDEQAVEVFGSLCGHDKVSYSEGRILLYNLPLIDSLNLVRKLKRSLYEIKVN